MPELPEVEVIRRGLAPRVLGQTVLSVAAGPRRLRRQSPPEDFTVWVAGRRILRLSRRGKYLLFHLEGGATLLVHLGMTGRLLLGPPGPLDGAPHVHLTFTLTGGLELAYQDVRRFGQVLVFPPGADPAPLAEVGREPFSRHITPAWLVEKAQCRSRPLKNFLLDGRIVAGIGNIYASEIMFAARLDPACPVKRLDRRDWERVLQETRRILRSAIKKGGTTVNDYLNHRGETGLFQLDLMVYGREGESCRRCGAAIRRTVQAGRSTFYCPRCQRRGRPLK